MRRRLFRPRRPETAGLLLLSFTLSNCGLSDQNSFMPAFLRYPTSPPPYQEPYPDVLALARTQGRSLFADRPEKVEISTPLFNAMEQNYSACVRATVLALNGALSTITIYVTIMRSQFFVRRRAEASDHCDGLDYTTVTTE